ncbi:major capsid protein [Fundidesulfovibrio putealis]|uniref:major capsid protein n=1 Tax=Fundidesulfovibrio putealis TaxID=270496 RepID=UPI0004204DB5|nr:phage major capsid protein [Fundidesulfovibrio putealis]
MATMTLVESLKYYQNPLQRGIVQLFPANSAILQYLPFRSIDGNSYSYNLEDTPPNVGFRAINAEYTADQGVINPQSEALKIGGGLIKIDRALLAMQSSNGTDILAEQTAMKVRAMSRRFEKAFIKGDATGTPEEFDGLELRVAGDQLMTAGTAAGGAALTLAMLDELIDRLDFAPTVLLMNKTMRRKVNSLMRAAGQATETVSGVFGQQIPAYAGVPIGIVGKDNTGAEILAFDEKDGQAVPAAASCTSIYALSMGGEGVCGIQNGSMNVDDQGNSEIWRKILVEWYCGLTIQHGHSVARLKAIKNA